MNFYTECTVRLPGSTWNAITDNFPTWSAVVAAYPTWQAMLEATFPIDVPAVEATVVMDEGWAPYVQATVEIAVTDLASLDYIDPREQMRLQVRFRSGYGVFDMRPDGLVVVDWPLDEDTGLVIPPPEFEALFEDGILMIEPDYTREFDLLLRSRTVDHQRGIMIVHLASDEALLQDYTHLGPEPDLDALAYQSSLRDILNHVVLPYAGGVLEAEPAVDFDFTITEDDRSADMLTWQPGETAMDFVRPLLTTAGLRLYCDENRKWRLIDAGYAIPGRFTVTDTLNAIEATDTISRDDTTSGATGVLVKYQWTDELGATQIAYDTAGSPENAYVIEYQRPFPGPGAAAYILARSAGKGRVQDITALPDFTVTPGMEIAITLPQTSAQVGSVSAVSWDFGSGEMRVKSRGLTDAPAESWALDTVGVAWDDVPAGTDWTEDI